METISKIRRAYFVQKKPIKVICRELALSVQQQKNFNNDFKNILNHCCINYSTYFLNSPAIIVKDQKNDIS